MVIPSSQNAKFFTFTALPVDSSCPEVVGAMESDVLFEGDET